MRKYFSYLALLLLIFITLGIWGAVFAATPSGKLTVAVMDVGQGDSIFIESPTGVQVVIDGGPDDSMLRDLPKLMPLADRSLDAIIETHPDADHIDGFIDLLKRYSVGVVLEPGIPKDTLTAKTFEGEVDTDHIPRAIARRGMWLDLGGGAKLTILFPDFDTSTLTPDQANEGAVVAQLTYASTSVLLMADAPKDIEDHLVVLDGANLKSDILKIGHHGSAGSSGETFIATVHPRVAVISLGQHNKYGFPKQVTLDTLDAQNIKTLRTDEEGTITFVSDGKQFMRVR